MGFNRKLKTLFFVSVFRFVDKNIISIEQILYLLM